jgi:hypothetical protein
LIKQIHEFLLEQLRGDILSPFLAVNKNSRVYAELEALAAFQRLVCRLTKPAMVHKIEV